MKLRNILIETAQNKNITTLDEMLDQKYGERGAAKREHWEQEFDAFHSDVLLEQAENSSPESTCLP